MSLRGTDLNLLVILQAILAEGSISRAALRLNLTQPAVSQALARARDLFGDPLLVRNGAGMSPTPRAVALAPDLTLALAGVARLFAPAGFDPASARREFTLSASDMGELLVLPSLVAQVLDKAPGCSVTIRSVEAQPPGEAVDLAVIGGKVPEGAFDSHALYDESFVLLAHPAHPLLKGALTPARFAAQPQALVVPRGSGHSGPVDASLADLGLARRIVLRLTSFASLSQVLATSDLVAAVPSRFAALPEVQAKCASRPLPFASPQVTLRLVWHRRYQADPGHRWLRGLLGA